MLQGSVSSRSQNFIVPSSPWVAQSNLNTVNRIDCTLPPSVEQRTNFSVHSNLPVVPRNEQLDLPILVWQSNPSVNASQVPKLSGAQDECVTDDNTSRSQINFSVEKPVSISSSDSYNEHIEIINSETSSDEGDLHCNTNGESDVEKPGEYSVLADELASLTTFNQIEKKNTLSPIVNTDSLKSSEVTFRKPHQGRKRRCLRVLTSSKPNAGNSSNQQSRNLRDDCIVSMYPNVRDVAFSAQRTSSQNHVHGKSNSFCKSYEKPHQSALVCFPTSVGSQVSRSNNSGSNSFSRLSQAQKRHATTSRRSK